ncbi:SGNH hydrolase domain-containing protein [Aeromicrobium panaciterrae]|uniref:acyltransferase family protein n=1 Tax=Aeromicrobium panaciterrae TaxID=363861 RepID=UPI0031DC0522
MTGDAGGTTFRRDIQGLRAIAVGVVVVFHLWPHRLTGGFVGVDVFFVISGYLITAHLLDRPPSSGRDLASFWARRIRRLLPAALLVIASTLVASRLVAPATQWAQAAKEAVASAFYVENWILVGSATDYLAAAGVPSPFQHFWSLSVEEQFYAGWPLIIAATFALARRRGADARRAVLIAVAVVAAASFAWSVIATANEPAAAYFTTPTRLWELAAGGLLAATGTIRLAPVAANLLAWFGLGAIAVSLFVIDSSTPFPGSMAALPVLGAVAFLAAGAHGRGSPTGPLGWRPIQWLGDASYSVYLWHWPLIVLAPYALDRETGLADKLGIVALTLVLAGLTRTYVEERWRRGRTSTPLRRPFQLALAGMLVIGVAGAAQGLEVRHDERIAASKQEAALKELAGCVGAAALARPAQCPRDNAGPVIPDPAAAAKDRPDTFANTCFETPPYTATPSCEFGTGPVRIALIGNSHAAHWQPAFESMKGVTLTTYLASECATVGSLLTFDTDKKAKGCLDWTNRVFDKVSGSQYDLVVTSQRNVRSIVGHEGADRIGTLRDGYRSYLERLTRTGAHVLVIRDTPFPGTTIADIPTCIASHLDDQAACSAPTSRWIPDDPLADAAEQVEGASVVDLNSYICAPERCYGVNGGIVTYHDGSHLTETYARTLGPYLAAAVQKSLGR